MATVVRDTSPTTPVLCSAINALKAQIGAGSNFHLDKAEVSIVSANASSLATSLTLANELAAVFYGGSALTAWPGHLNDTLAHKVKDATNTRSSALATSLATAIALANELKADFNAHIASTTYHYTADATNTIATADATDQSSVNTLLNAIKTAVNAHMASGPSAPSLRLVTA